MKRIKILTICIVLIKCIILNQNDSKAVNSARLEDKASVLYTIMENYDQSTAFKLKDLADYISGEALPNLAKLQSLARK